MPSVGTVFSTGCAVRLLRPLLPAQRQSQGFPRRRTPGDIMVAPLDSNVAREHTHHLFLHLRKPCDPTTVPIFTGYLPRARAAQESPTISIIFGPLAHDRSTVSTHGEVVRHRKLVRSLSTGRGRNDAREVTRTYKTRIRWVYRIAI